VLVFGGIAAFGFIMVAIFFPVAVGGIWIYFIYAMIAFMCMYILYDTSNVLHQYGEGQHVAAALELFVSVVTLFYYVLILFLNNRD
jgi:FtsH-binding integral membrane protein